MTLISSNSTGGSQTLLGFARLFRVPSSLLAGLAGFCTTWALNPALPLRQTMLTAVVLTCMTAASCTINDYWDVEKDAVNHPDRPLPSGQLSLSQAWWAAVLLFAGAVIASVPLGGYPLLLVGVNVGLLWYYSPLLKWSGILGNGVVATTIALLIFLSSLVAGRPFVMLYPTVFLFVYMLAREMVLDIHDAEGDRRHGVCTVANLWGAGVAFTIAWVLLGGLLVSLPVALALLPMQHPLLFGGFSALLLFSFMIPMAFYQHQQSGKAYDRLIFWERLGMLLGGLGLLGAAPF